MAVLYLSVSSGLAVEIHHCMGEIKDFSMATTSNHNKCGSCGMEKGSNKCCKDELKFVKIQDSYKLLNVDYKIAVPEADLQNNLYLVNNKPAGPVSITSAERYSPPGYPTASLFILNSVFRI